MAKSKIDLGFRHTFKKISTFSHSEWEVFLKLIKVAFLEFEDVLFHYNSAVMMPENPKGTSSAKDHKNEAIADDQAVVTGVKALALVFNELDFDPEKRLLIAAHTDTAGSDDYNFDLSKRRALNVLYLLTEERSNWAKVSYEKHKVEDYQQIMKYYSGKYACDPGSIDDSWGKNTRAATEAFISNYNTQFVTEKITKTPPLAKDIKPLPEGLVARIEGDSNKRWPTELWEAVYNLYSNDLCEIMGITWTELKVVRLGTRGMFLYDNRKYIACGESFPISAAEKDNYRSQENRRVEIMFFDRDEAPSIEVFKPCSRTKKKHTDKECPVWCKRHIKQVYVDPNDIYAVVYHLNFKYFDRVANMVQDVPEGLKIKAFENDTEALPTDTKYKNGVYYVKVQFKKPFSDPSHKKLHFEFEETNRWIYTVDDIVETIPTLVVKTKDEIKRLPFKDRLKYYDLPIKWSSRNYWTRWSQYDGKPNKQDFFENVIKKLKPLGGGKTSPSSPMVFSLDDLVLLDAPNGTQDIKDQDHVSSTAVKNLSKSRIKIFCVDETTGFLKLYQSDPSTKSSARIPFSKNLIVMDPEIVKLARIIFFRDGFYPILDKRTTESTDWVKNGFVVGARAAVRHDSDCHDLMDMTTHGEFGFTGDYELHYFHNLHVDGDHPVSFTISYVSICFMTDCRAVAPIPSKADVLKFVDEGVYNANDHWNRKRSFLRETGGGDACIHIRPSFFFDERETFNIPDPQLTGIGIEPEDGFANHSDTLFAKPGFTTARQNALGGKPRFVAIIIKDNSTHYGEAWHWSIRPGGVQYSLFKLNRSAYADWSDLSTVTEHGDTFSVFTFAHELGHATGQRDEYVNRYKPVTGQDLRVPCFSQHYLPYTMERNSTSMMYHNCAPRLHHLWYPMHKINERIKEAGKPLDTMLKGKSFEARLERGGQWDLTYNRHIDAATPTQYQVPRDMLKPMLEEAAYVLTAAPSRKLYLALYDVGRDESSIKYFHHDQDAAPNAIEYQAVLVVRVLLSVQFDAAIAGPDRATRIQRINQTWNALNEQSRLVGGTKDIKNIYIHFMAGFSGDTHDAQRHYLLNFRNTNATPSISVSGDTTNVFANATHVDLVRYFLNYQPTVVTLEFLGTWVNDNLHEHFTLETIL